MVSVPILGKIKGPYLLAGVAVAVGAVVAFLSWRSRGSSLARTAGRELGGGAVDLAAGAVEGAAQAAIGAGEAGYQRIDNAAEVAAAAVVQGLSGDFTLRPIAGRTIYTPQRNLSGLQGAIRGALGSLYELEIQNTSDTARDVLIEMQVDNPLLDGGRRYQIGMAFMPPRTGIVAEGKIISLASVSPIIADAIRSEKLYANKYLVATKG